MIPRGILDIDWGSLGFALRRSWGGCPPTDEIGSAIEQAWDDGERPGLICLSVRSGFDALLQTQDWPAGTEVLMSAVTIPDMARIVSEHGFVPVPIDVHADSLAPDVDQIRARITPRTRAIVVAHLFGSRLNLSEIASIVREHRLQLWEDVAQGFAGDGFPGDADADVSLFSFGMIKTRTALGGAYLRFRSQETAERCLQVMAPWPKQPVRVFRSRIHRAGILKLMSQRPVFTLLAAVVRARGKDLDDVLTQSVRGFNPSGFFEQLRKRPCDAQVALLQHRLRQPQQGWVVQKDGMARELRQQLPQHVLLGRHASFPTHWVLPIRSRDPQGLRAALSQQGYDATVRASQLKVIPPPDAHPAWTTPEASRWVPDMVYLPLHPRLRPRDIEAIAATVHRLEADAANH